MPSHASFAAALCPSRTCAAGAALCCHAATETELQALEARHRVLDLFIWLCYRFTDGFEGREAAEEERAACAAAIDLSIRSMGVGKRARAKRAHRQGEDAASEQRSAAAAAAAAEEGGGVEAWS